MEISPIKYADLKKIQARFLSNSMGRIYFDYVYEQTIKLGFSLVFYIINF